MFFCVFLFSKLLLSVILNKETPKHTKTKQHDEQQAVSIIRTAIHIPANKMQKCNKGKQLLNAQKVLHRHNDLF